MDEIESLGGYLRRERELKNLSLAEVAKNTKVKLQHLRAIEEEEYAALPPATYVRGFLLAYARALGLDPNDIILRYDRIVQGRSSARPDAHPREGAPRKSKPAWVIAAVVAICLVTGYLIFLRLSMPPESIPVKPQAEELPPAPPPGPPIEVPETIVEEKPLSLQLKAIEEAWVRILIDGTEKQEMILKPGDVTTHQGLKRMELLIGNAGGIDLTFMGNPHGRAGRSGEVVTVVLTPEGVTTRRYERPKVQTSPKVQETPKVPEIEVISETPEDPNASGKPLPTE